MLIVSPSETKVKVNNIVYVLKALPSLEFSFKYLYYEPETDNLKKVIQLEDQLVYQNLTYDEVKLIQEFLSKLNDPDYLTTFLKEYKKLPDVVRQEELEVDPPKKFIHTVNDHGHYLGIYEDLLQGMKEVPCPPPKDIYIESFGVNYKWNEINKEWEVRNGYKENRKLEYLKNIDIGEQLGALFNAVEALASGEPLPDDFKHISSKIKLIKSSIPKE